MGYSERDKAGLIGGQSVLLSILPAYKPWHMLLDFTTATRIGPFPPPQNP